ncbi:MAG: glycoside hydrolase family 3 protein [Candidatus Krumholzibacteria bacterium]|nr:glycoside hydrolase family 3 protein [Candidatus Krumholzibacteria bacterium]
MSRDLAARLVVGLEGEWPTAFEFAWLAEWQPAGVILFSRNVKNYNALHDLCTVLHELVPDLEIMADHEGGPVSQLAAALGRPPCPWAMGVLDDVGLTARVFEQTGIRLLEVGIDRVLAPVADVLTEPRNPVIGARSFGSDSSLVSRHTIAAVTGLLEAGVKVCLKHWPGHGGSSGDSHLVETAVHRGALPAPFESGLTAGAGAVMVGHLLVGHHKDGADVLPATLDRKFIADSKRKLGRGHVEHLLFFADDITMGALGPAMQRLGVDVPDTRETGLFDPGSLPVAWFEHLAAAGCDRLLIRGIPAAAFPLTREPDGREVGVDVESPAGPEFFPGPYAETRQRSWAAVGSVFPDRDADLLWLDFSRSDRWGAAAGQDTAHGSEGPLEMIHAHLSRMFHSVNIGLAENPSDQPRNRLLVSSHRPLPDMEDLLDGLASSGVCLALGHPSLKTDLEHLLGMDWKVVALYDIAPDDLIGVLSGPES